VRDTNPTRALAPSGGALTLSPTPTAQPLGTWQASVARHRANTLASRCGREVTQPLALTLELVCMGYTYDQAEALAAHMNREGE
jgi:hypothetical protein